MRRIHRLLVVVATILLLSVCWGSVVAFQPAALTQGEFSKRALQTRTTRSAASTYDSHGQDISTLKDHQNSLRVGIVGAGAIAFATASILSKNGHDIMLWSPSGKGTQDLQNQQKTMLSTSFTPNEHEGETIVISAQDKTKRGILSSGGALEHSFVPRIATSCRQLVEENEIMVVCLPGNGHKRVFDEMAPYLASSSKHKHVIISSHASLGALYLMRAIEEQQEHNNPQHGNSQHRSDSHMVFPTITAWGTTVCTARRPSGTSVDIKSIRKSVDFCTMSQEQESEAEALTLCQTLFPSTHFQPRDGLLAISLSNLNPQNHLGMALGNMARIDKGEAWYQFEMTTPTIGRFLQDLDQERLDIAQALGVGNVKTIYEHFSLSFHVPMSDSISDMCQEIYQAGNDVYGPNSPSSRYITEDVPFGLVLTVALGRMVHKPAKLHESGILICNSMYGCDFVAQNDLLQALKLDQMSLDDLKRAVRSGGTTTMTTTTTTTTTSKQRQEQTVSSASTVH